MAAKDKIVLSELDLWRKEELIDQSLYDQLSIRYKNASWDLAAIIRWSLIIGSVMLGIGLIMFVLLIFKSQLLVAVTLSVLAFTGYFYGFRLTSSKHKQYYPKTGNALLTVASLILCGDIFAIAGSFLKGDGNWPILLLVTVFIYFVIAYWKKNTLLLVIALLGLATWFGTESGYLSDWGAYYLGLNYPMRFAIVSPVVIVIGFLHRLFSSFYEPFVRTYYAVGLLYLNLSLWLLSIFGAYGSLYEWHEPTHWVLLIFSLLWGLVSIGCFIIGARFDLKMFTNFAITFIIINLYTRYFEYFWDRVDKSLFFIILGGISVSLGLFFERRLKRKQSVQDSEGQDVIGKTL